MSARRFGEGRTRGGQPLDPASVLDGENVQRLWNLVVLGCLVSISRSRDGGALAVTVFSDGKNEREWFRNRQEAADWLDDVTASLDSSA